MVNTPPIEINSTRRRRPDQLPGLIVLGLVAKIVFGAVQTAVARREGAAAMRPTAPGRDDTQQPDASADGRSRA
jgi:hypothetical protein